jgi:alpha-tubulin suppressor-like RCC1 family protein
MRALLWLFLAGCGRIGFDPNASIDATDAPLGPQFASLALGNGHTCAMSDNGQLACWGDNSYGKLGLGDTTNRELAGPSLPRPSVGTVAPVEVISKSDFNCARLTDSTAKCWGNNDGGQLGTGDQMTRGDLPGEMGNALPVVQLAAGTRIDALCTGHYHVCVLVAGAVRCWGINDVSQDGYGDGAPHFALTDLMTLPAVDLGTNVVISKLACGFNFTCAVTPDGAFKCWGYNPDGELGLGDTATRGDLPGNMGDALPFVDLAGTADSVTLGYGQACALMGGNVKCWGANDAGQLGLGDVTPRGDLSGEMGAALPFVDLGTGAVATALALGANFSCALLSSGDVKCWGANDVGQLGQGDIVRRGDLPGTMGDALPRIQLPGPARAIAAGTLHACAILTSGDLACWGDNSTGELGLGDLQSRGVLPGQLAGVIAPSQLW